MIHAIAKDSASHDAGEPVADAKPSRLEAERLQPGAVEPKGAADVLSALTQLQDAFLGRGTFKRFLDGHLAAQTHLTEACGSASFLAALASVIRYSRGAGTSCKPECGDLVWRFE